MNKILLTAIAALSAIVVFDQCKAQDGPISGLPAATALSNSDLFLISQGVTSRKLTYALMLYEMYSDIDSLSMNNLLLQPKDTAYPEKGKIYFDTDDNTFYVSDDGITWTEMTGGGAGTVDGTGTASYVTVWDDANTLTKFANLINDGAKVTMTGANAELFNITSTATAFNPIVINTKSLGAGKYGINMDISGSNALAYGIMINCAGSRGIWLYPTTGTGLYSNATSGTAVLAQASTGIAIDGSATGSGYGGSFSSGSGTGIYSQSTSGNIFDFRNSSLQQMYMDFNGFTYYKKYDTDQSDSVFIILNKVTGQLDTLNWNEIGSGSGTVTGTGTAQRIPYWSNATALTDDVKFWRESSTTKITNSTADTGLYVNNTLSGKGIAIDNSGTMYGIWVKNNSTSASAGIYVDNLLAANAYGIDIDNHSGNAVGLNVINESTGVGGIYVGNDNGTYYGMKISNTNGGDGVIINTSGSGNSIVIQDNMVDVLTVDDEGNLFLQTYDDVDTGSVYITPAGKIIWDSLAFGCCASWAYDDVPFFWKHYTKRINGETNWPRYQGDSYYDGNVGTKQLQVRTEWLQVWIARRDVWLVILSIIIVYLFINQIRLQKRLKRCEKRY